MPFRFVSKHLNLKRAIWINSCLWLTLWLISVWNNFQWSNSAGADFSWNILFSWNFPYYMTMVVLGPWTFVLYQYWSKKSNTQQLLFHLVPAVIFGLIHQLVMNTFYILSNPVSLQDTITSISQKFITRYQIGFVFSTNGFLFYWLMLGLFFLIVLFKKHQKEELSNLQLKSDLTMSKLNSLQMQLQPHFLFNTFNTISMMARKNRNKEVVEMIAVLSDLLRVSLELKDTQLVSVREELIFTNKYLEIQRIRLKDRLNIEIDIPDNMLDLKIPSLLFQPIVENAFQHGIERSSGDAKFILKAQDNVDNYEFIFSNSGPKLPEGFNAKNEDFGMGLSNTISRLEQTFQDKYHLELFNSTEHEGVSLSVNIPKND